MSTHPRIWLLLCINSVFLQQSVMKETQELCLLVPLAAAKMTELAKPCMSSERMPMTKNWMTSMPHPPYAPDLAPSNCYIVSLDEKSPQRETFCWCRRSEQKMAKALKGIKINEFKNCFEQWKKSLGRCIASNGEYFEGDWV